MSERSMGSEFDRKRVDGNGEQRRQQNQQSNQAGGQQGDHPGPGHEGLADPVDHGLAQADPQKSVGTASGPGDANGSGSMGSTRRDDPPRAPRR